jgi:hypothetical protein
MGPTAAPDDRRRWASRVDHTLDETATLERVAVDECLSGLQDARLSAIAQQLGRPGAREAAVRRPEPTIDLLLGHQRGRQHVTGLSLT